jgi:AcrR family transcriptional regulator
MTGKEDVERRVKRTKGRLHSALISLIMESDYDKITVQDIIDRADTGRSTFYSHYETKDDLLISGLDHLTADIELHMAADPGADDAILPTLGIFHHISENHALFKRLIGTRGIDIVHKAAFDTFTAIALSAIERRAADGEQSEIPPEARAVFAAGSFMAFIGWWLDNAMPYGPDKINDMYRQMTEGSVRART